MEPANLQAICMGGTFGIKKGLTNDEVNKFDAFLLETKEWKNYINLELRLRIYVHGMPYKLAFNKRVIARIKSLQNKFGMSMIAVRAISQKWYDENVLPDVMADYPYRKSHKKRTDAAKAAEDKRIMKDLEKTAKNVEEQKKKNTNKHEIKEQPITDGTKMLLTVTETIPGATKADIIPNPKLNTDKLSPA